MKHSHQHYHSKTGKGHRHSHIHRGRGMVRDAKTMGKLHWDTNHSHSH